MRNLSLPGSHLSVKVLSRLFQLALRISEVAKGKPKKKMKLKYQTLITWGTRPVASMKSTLAAQPAKALPDCCFAIQGHDSL